MPQYTVNTALRLRSSAVIAPDNIQTVLPTGALVTDLGPSGTTGWLHVSTTQGRSQLTGYVSDKYVTIVPAEADGPHTFLDVAAVNLTTTKPITRNQTGGRAFPLNEPSVPKWNGAVTPDVRVQQLWRNIEYLNVEKSARYQPTATQTFCNIYAYDYCTLAGVYIPRVWWTGGALRKLGAGQGVPVVYGETVNEITANGLYDWFRDFGDDFGWQRQLDMDVFQAGVNNGKAGIIVAKRAIVSRSGHICAVIPENADNHAVRSGGKVTGLLQSQAGAKNKKAFSSTWYLSSNFSGFSWWLNSR